MNTNAPIVPYSQQAHPAITSQTVMVNPQPTVVQYTQEIQGYQPKHRACFSFNYNRFAGGATGFIQICCGISAVLVSIAGKLIDTPVGNSYFSMIVGLSFFFPTGILGLLSYKKNTCVIACYLTFNIFSSLAAVSMLITGIILAPSAAAEYNSSDVPKLQETQVVANAMISVLGLTEMVVSIVASSYCCAGVCCKGAAPSSSHTNANQLTGQPQVGQPSVAQPASFNQTSVPVTDHDLPPAYQPYAPGGDQHGYQALLN